MSKEADDRINKAFHESCSGAVIPMTALQKIFAHGHRLITEGVSDDELGVKLRQFVDNMGKGS